MFDEFEFEAWRDLTFLVVDWLVIRPSSTKIPPLYGRIRVRLGRRDIRFLGPFQWRQSDSWGSFPKMFFFFCGFSDILSIFLLKLSRVAFFRTQRIHSWCDGFQLAATNGAMDIFSFEAVSFCLSERHGSRVWKKLGHWHPVKMTEATVKATHFFCAIWHGNCREAKERIGFWILLSFNILPMRNNQSWQSLTVVWHHATSWNWRRENSHQKLDKFSWLQHTTCEKSHPILPGYW